MRPVNWMLGTAAAIAIGALGAMALVRRGMRWGSTPEERSRRLPGDDFLACRTPLARQRGKSEKLPEDGWPVRAVMTRAISINAPPERVWPWIAQLGRGAGWYSIDALDNPGRISARHIVSWIPAPQLGDATAIGYLRHLDPGRSLVWWVGREKFLGANARLASCFALSPEGQGTRLIIRMSAEAGGFTAPFAMLVFQIIDSIMARSQLLGIRERVEVSEREGARAPDPETGDRSQYQLYQVLYAAGGGAGVEGSEHAAKWREAAEASGLLADQPRRNSPPG